MTKASEQARLLFPYLLPMIERVAGNGAGGSSGAAGVGGAPSPHSLSSAHHTGTVIDSQIPQALLTSGARELTGHMSVASGITIDGVDLSVHVADPDAHHNRVTVGAGLTLATQHIVVDQAFDFTWTGDHLWSTGTATFNTDLQVAADIDFTGGNRSITGTGDITISPADDLFLNPVGDVWLSAGGVMFYEDDQEVRSIAFSDLVTGIQGFRWWERSDAVNYWQLVMGAAKFDELHVRVFVADEIRIDRGEEYWSKSYGIVETDFLLPEIGADVDVWFEDSPGLPDGNIFSVGDWMLMRIIDLPSGTLAMKCWYQIQDAGVNDYVQRDDVNKRQQWRLRRKKFGTTGAKVAKGNVILDAGIVGQGWLHLSALVGVGGGPFFQVGDFTSIIADEPQFTNRVRMGNLDGTVDYSAGDVWGFAAGNNLGIGPDAGFSGLTADATTGLRLFNTDIYLYTGADLALSIKRTEGIRIKGQPAAFNALYSYEFRNAANVELGGVYLQYTDAATDTNQISLRALGSAGVRPYASLLSESAVATSPAGDPFLLVQALNSSTNKFANITMDVTPTTGWMILSASDFVSVVPYLKTTHVKPAADSLYDLGEAALRYRTLYVDSLVATTIAGAALTGQTWTYPGSMTIDAVLGTDTLVSVANSGAGRADLSVDRNITLGGTVDGVDVSVFSAAYTAHIANAAAHHNPVTAGDGISLATQVVSVDASVVRTTRLVSSGNGLTGGGDLSANRSLSVLLATNSGMSVSGSGLTLAAGIGGTGIEFTTGVLHVEQGFAFSWTGVHSFSQDIQLDADLDFVGAQQITTTSGNLTLNPFADLILPSTKTDRSSDYADGIPIAGYSFHVNSGGNRQLTTHTIKADELHVRVFIADTVRVDVGEEYWGKSMGLVYQGFTTPASIGATVVVTFEDSVAFTGALFADTEWLMIQSLVHTVGLDVSQIWGQVSGYTDLGEDINGIGRQSWTFTLRSGLTSHPVKKGALAIDFGLSGQGYVHLSTLQSANGPWIQIGTWAGANPYTPGNRTIRTQIGNLGGISDALLSPTGYGLYSENAYLQGIVSAASDVVRLDSGGVRVKGQPAAFASLYAYEFRNTADAELGGVYQRYTDSSTDINEVSLRAIGGAAIRPFASLLADASAGGSPAGDPLILIQAQNTSSLTFANITMDVTPTTGTMVISATDSIQVNPPLKTGHVKPTVDITYDLGTASLRYRTLYANQLIVSGSISGGVLGGAEWEYAGSMVIDANSGSNTTVSISNQGAGRADLDVDRNITLTGTVDGVDISAHAVNPSAHHELAAAGDGITVSGIQVIAVDSTVVRTPATVVRTTLTLTAGAGLTGGGDLSANRTFDVVALSTGGLTVNANDVQIKLPAASGLTTDATGLFVADAIAGAGLVIASKVLAVGAGDGISVAADSVAVDGTVVRTTLTLTAGAGLTGGGTLAANRTFDVVALSTGGLQVNADSVQILLPANSGLVTDATGLYINASIGGDGLDYASGIMNVDATVVRTSRTLTAGAGMTGGGDLSANRTFDVVAANTSITVNANDLNVNLAHVFAWTGAQSWAGASVFGGPVTMNGSGSFNTGSYVFNTTPIIVGNLNFDGAARSITSTHSFTMNPTGDLTLDPSGNIYLPDAQEMRSATFTDLPTGIAGFRLWDRGSNYHQLSIGAMKMDELYARVFVADEMRIDRGEEYWSKSFGIVQTDFLLPAISNTVDVWFEDAPGLPGANLFSNGDWLLCRTINWATGLIIQKIWFQITAIKLDQETTALHGFDRQKWRLRRISGGVDSTYIKRGSLMLDAGVSGQGWIHLSALDQDGGPFIQIGDFTSIATVPQFTNRVRMGNLNGTVDYAVDTWGFAAGNNLGTSPSAGFSGLTADATNGLRLFNTEVQWIDEDDDIFTMGVNVGSPGIYISDGATNLMNLRVNVVEFSGGALFNDDVQVVGIIYPGLGGIDFSLELGVTAVLTADPGGLNIANGGLNVGGTVASGGDLQVTGSIYPGADGLNFNQGFGMTATLKGYVNGIRIDSGDLAVYGSMGIGGAPLVPLHIYSPTIATGTIGTLELFKITRALNSGVAYPQVVSFGLGTHYTNGLGLGYPGSRFDIKLKSSQSDDYTANVLVQTLLDNGNMGIGGESAPGVRLQILGPTVATGTIGTEEQIKMTRAHNEGVSYAQAASFGLGTYLTNGAGGGFPGSRLDINLKSTAAANYTADRRVLTLQSDGMVILPSGQLQVIQPDTSAAIPPLLLVQYDLSEEFIEFVGTVAAGNPIDTAAVGTYYGKVRVSVNGTFKYVALYNS